MRNKFDTFASQPLMMEPASMIYPPSLNSPGQPAPCAILSVTDVVRLATAGVKMEWEAVRDQVRPDPVPDKTGMFDCSAVLRPLVSRLTQNFDLQNDMLTGPLQVPFFLSAVVHGDKVYVFVASTDQPPIILEDDRHLYPSDALMAKLHLMNQFYKGGT